MKKKLVLSPGFVGLLLILFSIVNQLSAQSTQKKIETVNQIPPNVLKAVEKSCVNCHSSNGNFMAESKVNLSKWCDYSSEKQAAKANAMCKEISDGDMPPKRFRKKHPENIPTPEDIKIICDWAQSLQSKK